MFAERVVNFSFLYCGVLCSFNIGKQRSLLLFAIQNLIVFSFKLKYFIFGVNMLLTGFILLAQT